MQLAHVCDARLPKEPKVAGNVGDALLDLRLLVYRRTVDQHRTCIGAHDARHMLQDRRLASPVGPHEPIDRTMLNVHVQPIERTNHTK